ncbi:MAG: DUF4149 domain-containing protein [Sulfuricurvum sp.]|jgi:uncharacterized membrane protein|uniref:TMEM205-like domain-containing protein n=1 Tax=Sulfuricurvum kujiense TaxID=148813 RepID=A0A2D3WCZ0_9BACT|nr:MULTISPECIES: DUF4149 domain-containing protein [Sulfuricurvum]MDP2851730.1 DUF4149 domain-containing protein [Sulfuricurvum sp.]OHD93200.1 MAG: hypothetical protein A2517_02630 [Sulfuricurvum sp. RIFOXYD12_FULL_44_77]OHD96247.1 MAG: hypothetical protein A2552_10890 [Sulfuricurvum sp. RIFOXYD2_FULL_44_160]DAB38288.1 MAG TPA: hypothetical protein CFH83_06705 [Sulfuricurvum kujiense]
MNKKVVIDVLYILLIAMTAGAVLVLGVFVAAVVFHSEVYLTLPLLSRYEEGKIMGEIFRRFTYWAYFMSAVIAVYEVSRYKVMQIDKISILSALGSIGTLLLFSAVYTPKILEYQSRGEAAIDASFEALHKASEIDFKILLLTLLILFSRRAYLMAVKK